MTNSQVAAHESLLVRCYPRAPEFSRSNLQDVYDKIYPCGSKPARTYGNPKTHKLRSETDRLTFHPIVSSIGNYNYKLAKFLRELLNPIILSQHCTTEFFSFCKEIQKVSAFNKFMISDDVCILFTNIPFKETVKLPVNLIFEKRPEIKITTSYHISVTFLQGLRKR